MPDPVSQQQVLAALATIQDPDLGKDIVAAGFVKNLEIAGTKVSFELELTTPACPLKASFEKQSQAAVLALSGVEEVALRMTSRVEGRKDGNPLLPGVGHLVAVASGKGGVGKSTVAVNLAVSLAGTGARVGLLDLDIYGPSAQIMCGIPPGTRPEVTPDQQLLPISIHGLKVISMSLLAADDTPVIWRGPMVAKMVRSFLEHVEWGELDYMIVDLPPGTGDAQLTLSQSVPLSGAVIVTTPQDVSLVDARKGLELFRQVDVPVLGIVENMSFFICPKCAERTEVFRHGGGTRIAGELGVPLFAEIPLQAVVARAGDEGVPLVARTDSGEVGRIYRELAGQVASALAVGERDNPSTR